MSVDFPPMDMTTGTGAATTKDSSPYLLCLNDTADANYTHSSVFCNQTLATDLSNYQENADLQRIVQIIVPILFGIIFIVGLFGNALVVIVVASNKQMRNTTNLLIINLAIADLLFVIFCVPFTATDYVLYYWPFGETWCKMVQYLIIVTAYASVLTLVLMSIDRFLAVVYPVESISIRTEQNTLMAIAVTWMIILLACIPAFIAHGLQVFESAKLHYSICPPYMLDGLKVKTWVYTRYDYEVTEVCMFKKEYNHVVFQVIFMLTSYAIPLAIICLLYFGMLFRLWKSVSAAGTSRNSLRGKKRVTRLVVVVVGVFAVCWLPIQVVLVLKSLQLYDINDLTVAIQITSHVLGYMNSCVNPILYAFLSENFRKAFRKVIQCRWNICGVTSSCGGQTRSHYEHHLGDSMEANNFQTNETSFLTSHYENGVRHSIVKAHIANSDLL